MRRILYGVGIFCLCAVLTLGICGYQRIQTLEARLKTLEKNLNNREQELLEAMALGGTSSGKEENGQDTKEKGVPMEIYYLRELNGRVMVYREDKNTLFEPTQILLSSLPKELQKEIAEGKYLPSKEALYSFLENYSS